MRKTRHRCLNFSSRWCAWRYQSKETYGKKKELNKCFLSPWQSNKGFKMKIRRKKKHLSDVLWRGPLCTRAFLRICHAVTTEKFSYLCAGFLASRFSFNQICTACNLPPEPRAYTQHVERTQLWFNGSDNTLVTSISTSFPIPLCSVHRLNIGFFLRLCQNSDAFQSMYVSTLIC